MNVMYIYMSDNCIESWRWQTKKGATFSFKIPGYKSQEIFSGHARITP